MDAEDTPWRMGTVKHLAEFETDAAEKTYTLRSLNMLDQHNQLFMTNKPLETRVITIVRVCGNDFGSGSVPDNILRLGEQLLHQIGLAVQESADVLRRHSEDNIRNFARHLRVLT